MASSSMSSSPHLHHSGGPRPTPAAPLKKRSVVSCFIFKFDESAPDDNSKALVALFRRSGKVSTYRHQLAPIAGSIDDDDVSPLAAAWRELREETTLTPSTLELLRRGKSYTFTDESIRREWTVHPFAFRLRSGAEGERAISTDWEHEGWSWHDPLLVEDSPAFGGVPRLAESLRRVWFERDLGAQAGAVLSRGLVTLRNDYESGARQLASVALRVLRDVMILLDDGGHGPTDRWWANVRLAAWHIWKNGRESMGAAVMSVLLGALKGVEDIMHLDQRQRSDHRPAESVAKWRDAVTGEMDRRIALRDGADSGSNLAEAFSKYAQEKYSSRLESRDAPISILTLSESSSITLALCHLALRSGFHIDLRVLESRPLYEGVSLAATVAGKVLSREAPLGYKRRQGEQLVRGQGPEDDSPGPDLVQQQDDDWPSKLSITVFSDASAAIAAEGADIVLIGADRISASGAVYNKTGSLPTILSAKHVAGNKVQIVVLSESEKVSPPLSPKPLPTAWGKGEEDRVAVEVEENDPDQLLKAWTSKFNGGRVRNAAAVLSKVIARADGGREAWGHDGGTTAAGFDGVRVAVRNVFFEWVPPQLVDVYISEVGVWTVEDIAEHSIRLGAEEARLFGDL